MDNDKVTLKHYLPQSEWFDKSFLGQFLKAENNIKPKKFLNEKKYRLNVNEFSYRVINHWQEVGLIDDFRPDGKGWHRFSLSDLVWLNIVSQLRLFGFSNENIKIVRQALHTFKDGAEISECPYLDFYILYAHKDKKPVYLIACENGQSFIMTKNHISLAEELGHIEDYISINLNRILQKLTKSNIMPNFISHIELSQDEIDIIHALRFDHIENITIRLQDGQIAMLEKTFIENNKERLVELLKRTDFQDLDIKVRDGKVVRIQRKELSKPQKGKKSKLTQ